MSEGFGSLWGIDTYRNRGTSQDLKFKSFGFYAEKKRVSIQDINVFIFVTCKLERSLILNYHTLEFLHFPCDTMSIAFCVHLCWLLCVDILIL